MSYKDDICDANALYKAYLKTISSSKWKETTQKYGLDYLRQIFSLQQDLEDRTYRPGSEGAFTKIERGKIRPITTLKPRDRIVRHVLCDDILVPVLSKSLIYDNGASIKKKGASFCKKRLETHLHRAYMEYGTNQIYGLFGDFSKFYDNIPHEKAKELVLNEFGHDEYLAWMLDVLFENFRIDVSYMSNEEYENCMESLFNKLEYRDIPKELRSRGEKWMEKSVNIGDQLSQILGIFYPSKIDHYVKTVRSMKYYGRYNDDFYVFSNSKEELHDILKNIQEMATSLNIHINQKKTRIQKLNRPFRFLQITYNLTDTGKIERKINKKRVTSMRQRMKKMANKLGRGEISYDLIEASFRSWMGSFYKIMSKDQRDELISLFESLFDKKVTLKKKSGKWIMIIQDRDEVIF